MIKLEFCEKELNKRKEIVESFRKANLKNRQRGKIEKIEKWCEKYLNNVDEKKYSFNAIVEALPEELLSIKEYLDKTYDVSEIKKELLDAKEKCYIVRTLYGDMKTDAKNILLKNLNVLVCPYCNRNYVISDENINTCELDHFIPKSKYPIFASSFYNLIPSCPYCNGKKKEKEFKIYPHAQKKKTDELLRFTYHILGSEYLREKEYLNIKLEVLDEAYLEQVDILKLEEPYNYHKDIVQDVLKKKQIFSDAYLDSICKEFPKLFESEEDIKELVYGVPVKEDEYGKRPLSKMIHDIVNEVNDR